MALLRVLAVLVGAHVTTSCVYDSDDRCSALQYYVDDVCACVDQAEPVQGGCACIENSHREGDACRCDAGFEVSDTGACVAEAAPGAPCDDDAACEGEFDYCHADGYCTVRDCASNDDCPEPYRCDDAADPPFCKRPPEGYLRSCSSPDDCAGTEATFCEQYQTNQCLVEGCSDDGDCFLGDLCCEISALGIRLCIPGFDACPDI